MRTVNLTTGKKAITIITKRYLTADRLASIWTDLIYHEKLDINSSKGDIIKEIRDHIFFQGVSTYDTWYEDTDATPVINDIYEQVELKMEEVFPELL